MFIITDDTPNPNVKKFNIGRDVCNIERLGFVRNYPDATTATDSALAQSLFVLVGVESVMFGKDFISVTKNDDMSWQDLRIDVIDVITDHFLANKPVFIDAEIKEEANNININPQDKEIITQIMDLIETKVRPAVAQDGGDITFQGYHEGVVFVKMQGACSGCPSSTVTLKNGIENMFRLYIPEVTEVRAV
jgi:Fe-S cluster biogenesis protein NfuA